MSAVEDACACFDAIRDKFEVREGQPTESHLSETSEALVGILYFIWHNSATGIDYFGGIIAPDSEHHQDVGDSSCTLNVQQAAYNDGINLDKKSSATICL